MRIYALIFATIVLVSCASARPSSSSLKLHQRMDELQRSISALGSRLEVMNNDVLILQDQMQTTRIQVQKLEHHGLENVKKKNLKKLAEAKKRPLIYIKSTAPEKTGGEAKTLKNDPMQEYKKAYGLYEKKRVLDAQEAFENFVKKYPDHDYADNAVYWMGEAFYDQREYMLAIGEFKRVLAKYPSSNKVPDSLLKIGFCFQRLDDDIKAKESYVKVAEEYPYTQAAKIALEKLKSLSKS